MEKEKFKFYQQKAIRYTLLALIHNTNILPELSEEQREEVLNSVFNIMLNSLDPDAAEIWNDEILSLSKTATTQQNVEDIINIIKKDTNRD